MIPSVSTLPFFITSKLWKRIGLSLIERYCVCRQSEGAGRAAKRNSPPRRRSRVNPAVAYGSAVNEFADPAASRPAEPSRRPGRPATPHKRGAVDPANRCTFRCTNGCTNYWREWSKPIIVWQSARNCRDCRSRSKRCRNPLFPWVLARKKACLLYTSPSPRDLSTSRMPSSA